MKNITNAFSKEFFNNMEKISAGMMFTDMDRNVLYANKAFHQIFKTDKESIKGKKCWSIIHPERPECSECEKEKNIHHQIRINDEQYHLILSNSVLSDGLLLRIIQDITRILSEISQLREEVKRLRRLINSILGETHIYTICSVCKKIRLKDGSWIPPANINKLEVNGGLSHGLCPECTKIHIEKIDKHFRDMDIQ